MSYFFPTVHSGGSFRIGRAHSTIAKDQKWCVRNSRRSSTDQTPGMVNIVITAVLVAIIESLEAFRGKAAVSPKWKGAIVNFGAFVNPAIQTMAEEGSRRDQDQREPSVFMGFWVSNAIHHLTFLALPSHLLATFAYVAEQTNKKQCCSASSSCSLSQRSVHTNRAMRLSGKEGKTYPHAPGWSMSKAPRYFACGFRGIEERSIFTYSQGITGACSVVSADYLARNTYSGLLR